MTDDDIEVIDLTGLSDSESENGAVNRSETTYNTHPDDERHSTSSATAGVGTDDDDDDDDSLVEIPLNAESREQLKDAIATVSEARLRQVLTDLVETDLAIETALMKELVTIKRKTRDVVPRFELCSNCQEEFDVDGPRGLTECSFHPGELEVDEDNLVDWDEAVHGPMNDSDTPRRHPKKFTWTCCDQNGISEGCVQKEHQIVIPRKRRRI